MNIENYRPRNMPNKTIGAYLGCILLMLAIVKSVEKISLGNDVSITLCLLNYIATIFFYLGLRRFLYQNVIANVRLSLPLCSVLSFVLCLTYSNVMTGFIIAINR